MKQIPIESEPKLNKRCAAIWDQEQLCGRKNEDRALLMLNLY